MSHARQILGVFGGGVKPPFFQYKMPFMDENSFFETQISHGSHISFSVSQRRLVGRIWGPHEPCPENLGSLEGGGENHLISSIQNAIYGRKLIF